MALADGEIGLATDTREVYIGVGTQDLLNADVQVTPFLNAQAEVTDDLSNGTYATNNGILNFNIAGTEVLIRIKCCTCPLQHTTDYLRCPEQVVQPIRLCYKIYKRNHNI